MRSFTALLAAVCLVALASPASAQPRTPQDLKDRVTARRAAPAASVGNGIYRLFIEENYGLGVGALTVQTGPDHPAGAGKDVLFGNGVPGTSFMKIRDLSTGHDFVQGWYLTQPNEHSLDGSIGSVTPIGSTGFRTAWRLPSAEGGSASLTQEVVVRGATLADSTVEVTTNIWQSQHDYQVQYLWDVAVGSDDGPVLQSGQYRPFAPAETHETSLASFDTLATADNDGPAPTFATGIRGTAAAQFVCWPSAVGAPFGSYQPDSTVDISTAASNCTGPSGPDSAVILQFPQGSAKTVYTVTASLFSSPTVRHPTSIAVHAPRPLSSPSLTATLTDNNRPVPGQTLIFSTPNGSRLCTGVTGVDGIGGCGGTSEALAAAFGYTVTYPGGAIWAPSTGRR